MHATTAAKPVQPWYRQGWPWFLIAIPAVAVVASLTTVWIAVSTADGLVVDDYYQEGKAIEKTMARAAKAAELGLSAELEIRADGVRLSLSAASRAAMPAALVLTIAHPTRAGMDQVVTLTPQDGVFGATVEPLSAGRWLIQLEDDSRSWRMTATAQVPADAPVQIRPFSS